MAKPKGLLMPLQLQAFDYPDIIPAEDSIEGMRLRYPDIDWVDSDFSGLKKADGTIDIIELSDFYLEIVRKHHIEIILGGTSDFSTIIYSYLAHHCPWLKTNSTESALMCNSKYLTRKFIVPDENNLKYYLIKVDSPEDVAEAIKVVGFPMILKPTCGSGSVMIKKCENELDILEHLKTYREQEELGNITSCYEMNGKLLLGLEKEYPHLEESHMLAEEFISGEKIGFVEYCVQNGEITEIAFGDSVYWPSNPLACLGCSYPTLYHDEKVLSTAREMIAKLVQRLSGYGYDNCFSNLEYFILKDGSIKLMEINGRMFCQANKTTEVMLHNGDKFRMMFDLQMGIPITPPKYKFQDDDSAPKWALHVYINSMEEGLASEIFNYGYAEQLQRDPTSAPGLMRCEICLPKYLQITQTSDWGTDYAFGHFVGESFCDCMMKFKETFHKLLLNSSQGSVWDDEIFSWVTKQNL